LQSSNDSAWLVGHRVDSLDSLLENEEGEFGDSDIDTIYSCSVPYCVCATCECKELFESPPTQLTVNQAAGVTVNGTWGCMAGHGLLKKVV
jgi:hypothetical protein